jgi:hypothetical protein
VLTICTGWSPSGYEQYGRKFAESFARFWPNSVRLIVYGEEPVALPRGEFYPLSSIPGAAEFRARWKDDKRANGRDVQPKWKQGCKDKGYNFRFDAWKFSPQGFIPWAAAQICKTEYLCWLDGDVVTHKPVPEGFVEKLLPAGKDVAYLGRGDKHSEIGFQLYRLPQANRMLWLFSLYYGTDDVFKLKETHSAYVFDRCREESGILGHDLTPGGTGSVFDRSPLASFMTHLKGDRKRA